MALKTKSIFFCQSCGFESPKWLGKCPSCGEWNTFVEEKVTEQKGSGSKGKKRASAALPVKLSEIEPLDEPRIHMPSEELNRVLGGGLVAGCRIADMGDNENPAAGRQNQLQKEEINLSPYP